MLATFEDGAEVAGVAGFAMTAGTVAEIAISILGTDAMDRIEMREVANVSETGIAERERVIGDAHDRQGEDVHHLRGISATETPL
ncbi:uncharacterized protein ColSpa_07248 [Colletotrichum spaethianum]|uniref:Uncharacterized protein n=1 Tax=Colletotrichum spaethianum TaxID=700344 RepID=A0AA37LLU5_9PEZI|nr:uncharacterized protein ColSpa_07248 [Colletotrichum spaethianum]GKT47067.1 hypothetical protein ColSpa_07248 [Colletotrichum spaethianum]